MDEHDPLNLDADAMRYEDVRVPGLRATIASLQKTMEVPRYKNFFDATFVGSKVKVMQWIEWSQEHIRRDGEFDGEGDFSVDAAVNFMKAAEEEVQYVTDRVDDWASDPLP